MIRLRQIDQEDLARLHPPLEADLLRRNRQHAGLAREDDELSSVTTYRLGRKPLRSSMAPMRVPSQKTRLAGPSRARSGRCDTGKRTAGRIDEAVSLVGFGHEHHSECGRLRPA